MVEAAFHPMWAIIREARARAGLTQAELAGRAGTTQSAVAAYERARRLPDWPTVSRLVEACGLELRVQLTPLDSQRRAGEEAALARSVEDRLRSNSSATAVASALRSG